MKSLFLCLALVMSGSAMASEYSSDCPRGHDSGGNCIDDSYFSCSASDGRRSWTVQSNGMWERATVQYRVIKKCRAQSSRPASCRPLGCQKTPL